MSRPKPEPMELDIAELEAILERTRTSALDSKDRETLRAIFETLIWVTSELEKKNTSIARLRKDLSISTKKTEKASEVLKGADGAESPPGDAEEKSGERTQKKKKKKRKGHGRNGADAYKGAEKIKVPHDSLKPGDSCLKCLTGKLYPHKPRRLVRVRGEAPIQARVWELESLRCNLCGEVCRAEAPADVGKKKYDETSASMIALLKYGNGFPFYRLARLEGNLGIPLPAATQWDLMETSAGVAAPAYEELIRQAAQGEIFYNDDTTMKILSLLKENEQIAAASSKERTGMFTSGIVSKSEGRRIALFFTGRKHAGENLEEVLKLGPPTSIRRFRCAMASHAICPKISRPCSPTA